MSIQSQVSRLQNYLPELDARSRTFGESLITQWTAKKRLSQEQQLWVDKLIDRAVDQANERVRRETAAAALPEQKLTQEVGPLFARFKRAQEQNIQAPRISTYLGDSKLVISLPKESKGIYIRLDGAYLGKIDSNGRAHPFPIDQPMRDDVIQRLSEIAENPSKAGKAHGQKHNNCMFCMRDLTTTDSVYYGYGPICAEKWGLEWGDARQRLDDEKVERFNDSASDAFESMVKAMGFKCE